MRFFVDITAHGWGHLAQTAPIISTLRNRIDGAEFVVRSGLPRAIVEQRCGPLLRFYPSDTDFGVAMATPFVVDRDTTLERYTQLHASFSSTVSELAALIAKERCNMVLSNVGYLAIAAGRKANVPTVAISSLNWGDLFQFYCGENPSALEILRDIDRSYASADLFLRLVPGLPMDRLQTMAVSRPIANIGTARRSNLAQAMGASSELPIIVCAFGGMLPDKIPPFATNGRSLTVIGPATWVDQGVIPIDSIQMPYSDVLASADLVVTKPGYGIVSELGCLAKPSVMILRGDWPEQSSLLTWLSARALTCNVDAEVSLQAADLRHMVASSLKQSQNAPKNATEAGGEHDVVDAIIKTVLYR